MMRQSVLNSPHSSVLTKLVGVITARVEIARNCVARAHQQRDRVRRTRSSCTHSMLVTETPAGSPSRDEDGGQLRCFRTRVAARSRLLMPLVRRVRDLVVVYAVARILLCWRVCKG